MRLGSITTKQDFGRLGRKLLDGEISACALGAANIAFGGMPWKYDSPNNPLRKILATPLSINCPDCGSQYYSLSGVIPHLNDYHRRTRSYIADFLEKIGL